MNMMMDKLPPHSMEAEQAVLGSILLNPDCIHDVALSPDDFYVRAHHIIFQTIRDISDTGRPVDLVTLTAELQGRKRLDEAGGVIYLNELASTVPTAANAEHYAKIVEEKAMLRRLIQTAEQISATGYSAENPYNVLSRAEEMLLNVTNRAFESKTKTKGINSILSQCNDRLTERIENPGKIQGLSSGFPCLDKRLLGFKPGQLIVLAARPAMGKSVLALNIAANVAVRGNGSVTFFNLEMNEDELGNRLICSEGNLDSGAYYSGRFTPEDYEKYSGAMATLSDKKLMVNSNPGITVPEIKAECRRIKRESGLDLVVVDYLQLISSDGYNSTRNEEVSRICRALKVMALELEVPVIALSQLSRSVEQRQDKRPMLSDLRDSGSIEQDADVVMFLYRDDYYNEESEKKNIAELIIAKQRSGPVGKIEYLFLKNYSKFLPLEIQR
ncbi:replicative DNA helicase [Laceyella sacchari]|uniref:replicative DNA helicase n=1 Tax=Laceyella sacchari TaxID=37482 RepID=UPI0010494786|nr:replicative DNA helicase [Laceyella sacchari]